MIRKWTPIFFVENSMSKFFFVEKITSVDECNERVFKFLHQIFSLKICFVEKLFRRKLFWSKNIQRKKSVSKMLSLLFSIFVSNPSRLSDEIDENGHTVHLL